MRSVFATLAMGALLVPCGHAAPDLVPTDLTVKVVDSLTRPELDSVEIVLQFDVRGEATRGQPKWVVSHLSVDGVLRMEGNVDSAQVLLPNTNYTNRIGAWVEKKPFSVAGYADPLGVSGENPLDAQNNSIIRKYDFHPARRVDTVYTGTDCRQAGGAP
jgi:hypothetical protein